MTEIQQMTSVDALSLGSPGPADCSGEIATAVARPRPTFFKSKARVDEEPQTKSLRLLLNKLTPTSSETQLGSILCFDFNQDLIRLFSSLMMARVSTQRTLSSVLARTCDLLRQSLQLKNPPLAIFFTATATEKLEEAAFAAIRDSPEKLAGLLSLAGALAVCEFCSATIMLTAMTEALRDPSDVSVDAVCGVFKSTVPEILAVEDVKPDAEDLITSLTEIWHTNSLLKRTQFLLQDIIDSKDQLLTPKPRPVPEAPVHRRKSSTRTRKRVSFPSDVTQTEIAPSSPVLQGNKKSICRTNLSVESKTKARGVIRQVMEDHDVTEATRSLLELLKTVDVPAVSELILQIFKYMLVVMSMHHFQDVCLVVQQLLQTEHLSKTDVEAG